ncbi:hypothetical protein ACPPVO_36145 [Dactylosporangium sp. McL0621]|uniref:hypothetical protein n=1 Tax=Dactylosporangium sp. McL0621 TaxID=3415678 RepID=UPI003CE7F399
MRLVRIGDLGVELDLDAPAEHRVGNFVNCITDEAVDGAGRYRLRLAAGDHARFVMDPGNRTMSLTIPPVRAERDQAIVEIGLLQALTRGIAFIEAANLRTAGSTALLHGSSLAVADDCAVAVLDGGLGQGKTSLTMGLAARYGQLMVDEFTFVTIARPKVTVLPAPHWPWHVRRDMAPHLLPADARGRLLFASDLHRIATTADQAATLRMVIIPDRGLPAGQTVDVPSAEARHLLRCAVTDHLSKLVDPGLDHVSIFESSEQVATADGTPLQIRAAMPTHETERVLDALVVVAAIRVGIGAPADLPASVTAAGDRLTELLPWYGR